MKKKLLSMMLASVMLFTAACGVKQEDYDKVVAEKDQLTTQLAEAKSENEEAKKEIKKNRDTISELADKAAELSKYEYKAGILEITEELISELLGVKGYSYEGGGQYF